ncbi:MAG: hypothetical protein KBB39_00075 [Phycicoccus sp.]|nr:hypothetical protein [Phycicoccus sp.]
MLGFPVEAFGLSWWFDTSRIDAEMAVHLRDLWSRTDPVGAGPLAADLVDPAVVGSATVDQPLVDPDPGVGERLPFVITRSLGGDDLPLDRVVVPEAPDAIPYAVSRAFTLAGVRRRTGEALMLHAVGVAGGTGDVVALVGKSGTGKTTAATHLGRRLGYVTDETVVIEDDFSVSPYPKPLSIITDPQQSHAKIEHSPNELDLLVPPEGLRLGAVVVLVRDPDEADPRIEAIGLVEAALAVLPETSALPKLAAPLRRLAEALIRNGGPYRLAYSEIDACLDVIAELAEHDPRRDGLAPEWTHIPGDPDVEDLVRPTADPSSDETQVEVRADLEWASLVRRAPFSDAISSQGDVLLLRGHRPIALGGLSAHVWLLASEPLTLGQLHTLAVESIGPHPQSEQLVIEAAQALLQESLLEIERPAGVDAPAQDDVRVRVDVPAGVDDETPDR